MKAGRLSQPSDLDHLFSWMWVKFPNTCMEPVGSSPKNSSSKHIPSQKKKDSAPLSWICISNFGVIFSWYPDFEAAHHFRISKWQSPTAKMEPSAQTCPPKEGFLVTWAPRKKKLAEGNGSFLHLDGQQVQWRFHCLESSVFFLGQSPMNFMKCSVILRILPLHSPRKSRKLTWSLKRMVFQNESPFPPFSGSMLLFLGVLAPFFGGWIRSVRWRIDGLDLDVFDESIPNPLAVLGWNMGRYLRYPPWN